MQKHIQLSLIGTGWLIALASVGAVQAADGAAAAESIRTTIGLRTNLVHSDNLGRDELKESGTFGSVGTLLDFSRAGSRLDLSLVGELDYFDYSSNRFDSEVVGRLSGQLTAKLIPERFNWVATNDYGQIRRDPLRAESPENREFLNVFSTGPDLALPLDDRTIIRTSARYSLRNFEDSNRVDSDVISGEFGLQRVLSPTRDVGLVATARSIEFDSSTATPYDVYGAFLRYGQTLANGSFSFDLGANQLRQNGETEDGTLLRLAFDQRLTARSTLYLRASQEFQDAGDAFRFGSASGSIDSETGDVVPTSDPLVRRQIGAEYRLEWDRTNLSIHADAHEDDYESETRLDRRTWQGGFRIARSISPLMTAEVGVSLRKEEFDSEDFTADELRAFLGLTRQLAESLDLSLRYEHWNRDSDGNLDSEENRALLTLTYYPFQR